jgi:hypothetical protein
MDVITQQLNEKLESLPFYTTLGRMTGRMNIKMVMDYHRKNITKYYSFFHGRKGNNRLVTRCIANGLVINKIQQLQKQDNLHQILALNHDNIEKILYYDELSNADFFIWITPLFVTKLKTVWEKAEQFRVYDVKKVFHDLLNGLECMKSKNVSSGVIHEDNLAYNGYCWFISGVVNSTKPGECSSGVYTSVSLKSRRHLCYNNKRGRGVGWDNFSTGYIPEDDLWQLILMYVITYYGFNPFQEQGSIFLPNTGTILSNFMIQESLCSNIIRGKCQDITLGSTPDHFGKILKNLLTSEYLNDYSYQLFRYIIENNGTPNTEGLETLVSLEIRAAIQKREDFTRQRLERLENERLQREDFARQRLEREIIETTKTLTDNRSPLSLNVDQYIEKYKHCECIVCFSNTIFYKFSPCTHEICCHSCYTRLDPKKCPMCRSIILNTEKLSIERIKTLNEMRKNIYVDIKSF